MTIEEAYREGYADGYSQGEEDAARLALGNGKIRQNTRTQNKERTWKESKAFKSIAQAELPLPSERSVRVTIDNPFKIDNDPNKIEKADL